MAKNDIVLIDSIINGLNGSAPMTGQRKGELGADENFRGILMHA